MKTAILTCFLYFLLVINLKGNNPKISLAAKSIDTVKVVNSLKNQFMAIDAKRKSYSQYMAEQQGNNTEGVIYTGFYEGKSLKMINAYFYGDASKTENDNYINETGIFLIYSKFYEFESPLSVNPRANIKTVTENWYYFNNEELIKWVSAGKVKSGGSEEFRNKKIALKDYLKNCKKPFGDMNTLRKIK